MHTNHDITINEVLLSQHTRVQVTYDVNGTRQAARTFDVKFTDNVWFVSDTKGHTARVPYGDAKSASGAVKASRDLFKSFE